MSAINEMFYHEPRSPFFEGYELLLERSKARGIVEEVCRTTYSKRYQNMRRRARAVGSFCFPDDDHNFGEGHRAKCLGLGLIIGMCAGYLTVPLIARGHYAEVMGILLDSESDIFGGYHHDTSLLEEGIDPRYLNSKIAEALPPQEHDFLDRTLLVGVGWSAQQVDGYHKHFLGAFRPTALWIGRDMYRREIRSHERTLSKPGEVTVADIRGDDADVC